MSKNENQAIIILRSPDLLQQKGQSKEGGVVYSRHESGLRTTQDALDEIGLAYKIWDENDWRTKSNLVKVKSPRIIIVPEMRTCHEETFQKLKDYAEKGWIIFAIFDSFYYKWKDGNKTERVILERVKDLFPLSNKSTADTRRDYTSIEISFPKTRYEWLTQGLPPSVRYAENNLLGVVGQSDLLLRYGDAKCEKISRDASGKETKEVNIYPAFLIREYDSGGLFIYCTFLLRKIDNSRAVFRNLYGHKIKGKITKQVQSLMWIVVIEAAFIGVLISKLFINIGNPWAIAIGTAIISGILGWLITKLTKFADKLLKDN